MKKNIKNILIIFVSFFVIYSYYIFLSDGIDTSEVIHAMRGLTGAARAAGR